MSNRTLGLLFLLAGLLIAGGGWALARRFRAAAAHAGIGRGGHGPLAGLLGILGGALLLFGLCAAVVGAILAFA